MFWPLGPLGVHEPELDLTLNLSFVSYEPRVGYSTSLNLRGFCLITDFLE